MVAAVPWRGRINGEQLGLRRTLGGCDVGRMLEDAQVAEDGPHDGGMPEAGVGIAVRDCSICLSTQHLERLSTP